MWEQGTHLLHSKRSAWQIIQLRGPSLKVWESYPNGHLPPVLAASATSFSASLLSASAWFFLTEASSERADFENGQAASDCCFLEEASSERPDFAKGQADSGWCFREEASSGRADFTKGQTGVILTNFSAIQSKFRAFFTKIETTLSIHRQRWGLNLENQCPKQLDWIENSQNCVDFCIQCRFPIRIRSPSRPPVFSKYPHRFPKWPEIYKMIDLWVIDWKVCV